MRTALSGRMGILAAALLAGATAASAQTPLGGEITSSVTLTSAGNPYVVSSDLIVRNGAVLTFQAGVVVRFGPGASLIVENGALRVTGAPAARAVFTSVLDMPGGQPAPGDWGFVRFLDGTVDATTRLEQLDVRFGQGITIQGASPALESVAIDSEAGPAISIDLASFPTGSGDSATNCALNAILVASGEMTARGAWSLKGIPYVLEGPVSIGAAPSITGVQPVDVERDSATAVSISGLRLDGTTAIAFAGTGVTGQVLLGGTTSAVPVLVNVDPAAPLGTRTFTLDAAAGLTGSGSVTIRIVPGTPVIQSLD
ncbi:MAG TPA: hypothetical protein VE404_03215, partial [Verrucomicrobiae bacterium]|nr:hypothetical protein [Verrucomicrobiae bacterium]